jgi:hypothetical protein
VAQNEHVREGVTVVRNPEGKVEGTLGTTTNDGTRVSKKVNALGLSSERQLAVLPGAKAGKGVGGWHGGLLGG